MAKLQKVQHRYSITIPQNIIRLLKWEKGDDIILETDFKGKLYLIKDNN